MPLKCLRSGEQILAFRLSDPEWAELRAAKPSARKLTFACCGVPAVPKTSSLGTRFFAHARRGTCTTAPETAEHLLAKSIIAEAVVTAGWGVCVEEAGETPDGSAWVADVLAEKGKAKVAFEVQWSKQTEEETSRRQERYRSAGIRALWLMRQVDVPMAREAPAFGLEVDRATKHAFALLPKFRSLDYTRAKSWQDGSTWQQRVELSSFVRGALAGRLMFAPVLGKRLPVLVHGAPTDCWKCGRSTTIVTTLVFAASRVYPDHPDIHYGFGDLADSSQGQRLLASVLSDDVTSKHGIGRIVPRYSKTVGSSYLSNGCVHCDALQGRFFAHEVLPDAKPLFEREALFSEDLAEETQASEDVYRWWFDEVGGW